VLARRSLIAFLFVAAIVGGLLSGASHVGAAPAIALTVTAPASVGQATPFDVNVTAVGIDGLPDTSFAGIVHFSASDPAALLPADTTLIAGVRFFSVAMSTPGAQTITVSVTDSNAGISSGSAGVTVVGTGAALRQPRFAPGNIRTAGPTRLTAVEEMPPGSTTSIHGTQTGAPDPPIRVHRHPSRNGWQSRCRNHRGGPSRAALV
jgi:hypothetical protein